MHFLHSEAQHPISIAIHARSWQQFEILNNGQSYFQIIWIYCCPLFEISDCCHERGWIAIDQINTPYDAVLSNFSDCIGHGSMCVDVWSDVSPLILPSPHSTFCWLLIPFLVRPSLVKWKTGLTMPPCTCSKDRRHTMEQICYRRRRFSLTFLALSARTWWHRCVSSMYVSSDLVSNVVATFLASIKKHVDLVTHHPATLGFRKACSCSHGQCSPLAD